MNSITIGIQLNHLLSTNKVKTVGVYASDRLPAHIAPSTAIVVNTRPHTHRGEHWVAFYRASGSNLIEYFDSIGRPPFQAEYQQFLRKHLNCHCIYNHYRLQGYDTSVCGHYCLTYLNCRIIIGLKSVNDYVQLFDISKKQQSQLVNINNDSIVRHLFDLLFNINTSHRRRRRNRPKCQSNNNKKMEKRRVTNKFT